MLGLAWSWVVNVVLGTALAWLELFQGISALDVMLSLPIVFGVYRLFVVPLLGDAVKGGTSDTVRRNAGKYRKSHKMEMGRNSEK